MSNLLGLPVYQKGSKKPRKEKINDNAFLAWLRTLPCCVCGKNQPSEACHYRTAANSGIGIKPLWSSIPMCHSCHMESHRIGTFNFMPRERWEALVKEYLDLWHELN